MSRAPHRVERTALPRALALAWSAAPLLLVAQLTLTVAAGAAPVAVAWLLRSLLDGVAGGGTLTGTALALAAAGFAVAALPDLARYAEAEAEADRRTGRLALDRLYTAIGRFAGLARFESPEFLDRLQLAQQAGRSGPGGVVQGGLSVLRAAVTLAGFVLTLLALSPAVLALVSLAGLPAAGAQLGLSRRRAAMLLQTGRAERREAFYANLVTSVQAAKEVRLLGLSGFFRGRMLAELRRVDGAHRRLDRRELGTQAALELAGAVAAGAALVWAARAAADGRLTVGDVAVLVAAVAGVQAALAGAILGGTSTHHALLLFGHFDAVVRAEPDLPEPARPREVPPLRRGIELRDVWFRYGDEHPWVLRGVSLTIPAGAATALAGRNGAGKSTLVKLLCRFYDPTRGAILWDGVDLRDLPVAALRERIGAVFQDFVEYDLTAAENVGLGDLAALDDRPAIERAAARAGVDGTVAALPHGWDTLLTRIYTDLADRDDPATGVVLSGGQWQRLALARAYLRADRDLLILDEPSAGLDAEAEAEVHAGLRAHRAGRTSVLISHRLGAVRDADSIVVLAGGRVVEQGDHRALLDRGGDYARLFSVQAAAYQPVPS